MVHAPATFHDHIDMHGQGFNAHPYIFRSPRYSVLNHFIGLATAALIAWKLIVSNAINNAINVVMANTTQLRGDTKNHISAEARLVFHLVRLSKQALNAS
jgi:hypothetical protein